MPRAITAGLRLRAVDVLTAGEDGAALPSDPDLLDRATALGRVLFSQDDDLLAEASRRQTVGLVFSCLIYGHQVRTTVGGCVRDLELIAGATSPDELAGRVLYLPL